MLLRLVSPKDPDPLTAAFYSLVGQPDPFSIAPLPGIVMAGRYGVPVAQSKALEQALSFLRQRIPSFMNAVDKYAVRVVPGAPNMGRRKLAGRVPEVASTWPMIEKSGGPALVKIHPNELGKEELPQTIFHELAHLLATKWPNRLLKPMADKARQTIPQEAYETVVGRPYYRGNDLLEELAIRMMESNVARKRLMP